MDLILEGWTVYIKSDCESCINTIELIQGLGEKINVIECDDVLQKKYIRAKFYEHINDLTGKKYHSFPIVFKNDEFIGGYNDTKNYLKMQIELLKFWCQSECFDIMRDICNMKKYTKDPEIIYNQFNKNDIQKILFLDNLRISMAGNKLRRDKFEIIEILNSDVIEFLFSSYQDILIQLTEQNINLNID